MRDCAVAIGRDGGGCGSASTLARLWLLVLVVVFAGSSALPGAARAAAAEPGGDGGDGRRIRNMDALSVVLLRAQAHPDARSSEVLGAARQGSGIVIDDTGLILTIGYLVLETEGIEVVPADGKAVPATLVAYDNATGLALVRSIKPLNIKPIAFGESETLPEREPVLVAGFDGVAPAYVVSKRPFTGYWEYLLDSAIFTAPATVNWSGAALIGRDGRLYGVGSLVVTDAIKPRTYTPGNMFVPVDVLKPILGDLIANGRGPGKPRPWIGVNTQELQGHLVVTRVSPGSPAENGGMKTGDIILSLAGEPLKGQADFYRKLWGRGPAGTDIALSVLQDSRIREITLRSMDRSEYMRARPTY